MNGSLWVTADLTTVTVYRSLLTCWRCRDATSVLV